MGDINAKQLLKKYATGNCNAEERALVEAYYNSAEPISGRQLSEQELEENLNGIWAALPVGKRRHFKLWHGISVAAAVFLMVSAALYFYSHPYNKVQQTNPAIVADIAPGKQNAVLTLANGQKISLIDAAKGDIAHQAGIRIVKTDDGNLAYSGNELASATGMFNTIETPKGCEFQLNLPDGTKVWLNAASSLKYPVSFNGKERRVILTGEAYFEVARNKKRPFKVATDKQEVEVLGTHFNINSYDDTRGIKTTLVEGSVKVRQLDSSNERLLKPGQLSVVLGKSMQVLDADIESELDWKNGYFVFNADNIQSIMRKISRWYDIEVVYHKDMAGSNMRFGGIVSRNKNISVVLKTMERAGQVHFKLEGKKVTVMP